MDAVWKWFVVLVILSLLLSFLLGFSRFCLDLEETNCRIGHSYKYVSKFPLPTFTGFTAWLLNPWWLSWIVEVLNCYVLAHLLARRMLKSSKIKVVVLVTLAAVLFLLTFHERVDDSVFPPFVCKRYFMYELCYQYIALAPSSYYIRINVVSVLYLSFFVSHVLLQILRTKFA